MNKNEVFIIPALIHIRIKQRHQSWYGRPKAISGKDRTLINLSKGAVTAPLQVSSLIEIS